MKPNFALSLSPDGISLLHRAVGGWRLVGEVSPASDDLKSELAALRETAVLIAPDGILCKLVIPNEQVRYLSIETPGMNVDQARDAAYAALDGTTPYAMNDLIFDVTMEGDVSHIAAVAVETLEEAEAFAAEHGLNPVSFVAVPQQNAFLGEPYFGPATVANGLLGPGQSVEQDGIPIVVIGDVERPQTDPGTTQHLSGSTQPSGTQDRQAKAVESLRSQAILAEASLPEPQATMPLPEFASRRRSVSPAAGTPFPIPVPDPPRTTGFAEKPAAPVIRQPQSVEPPREPAAISTVDEAQRLTTFGARAQAPTRQTSRLKAVAVLAASSIAVVAVVVFTVATLPDLVAGLFDPEARESTETTAIQVAPPVPQSPVRDDTITPESADLTDEDAAVLNALRTPVEQREAPADTQISEEVLSKYAVTGIWPVAPQVPNPPPLVDIEDLYVTSIDRIEPAFDAVALPQPEGTNRDIVIDAPPSPAAAGTAFALDNRGLVIGTEQGALSPDGIRIFAGPPPVRPTSLPVRNARPAEPALTPARPELAALRPRQRPSDIVETTERATLDGLTRSELAEIRPPLRPTKLSGAGATAASLVPLDGRAGSLSGQNNADTQKVVAVVTQRPDIRPSNFNQIVARAQNASTATAQPASVAPRAVVKPSIPSSASVAREATVKNAINMRKINLIGVYGTPSQRRALVRLSNGRYKKVEVGDRIDGGNISAIGEGELRYQKSGRNIILKMPKG